MELIFDHIGLITDDKKDKENWVEATRVWVTNPKEHPFYVEWLRYEKDSPVQGPVRTMPHIAYRVKSIEETSKSNGLKVLLAPFVVDDFLRVGFFETNDGAVIELMEYLNEDSEWFPDQDKE